MKAFVIAAAALLLAGCGGGGDSTAVAPSIPSSAEAGAPVAVSTAAIASTSTSAAAAAANAPVDETVTPAPEARASTLLSPTAAVVANGAAGASASGAASRGGIPQIAELSASDDRAVDPKSVRAAVLKVLQDERKRCGFSALAQDANLDRAAANHADYLARDISNGTKGAHTEVPGTAGFTGETPLDRAVAAGYKARAVNEAFAHSSLALGADALDSTALPTDRAATHTRFLLSTVYHMQALLGPRRDLGVGYTEQSGASAFAQVTVLELGIRSDATNAPQADLLTYPCEGTTAAYRSFVPSKENPNPLPSVGDATIGTPLYLRAPEGKTLVLRSHSVTGPDGLAVATTVLNAANDPAGRLTTAQVFVLPQKVLTRGAVYTVTFDGTVDGTAFTRQFRFQPS